MTDTLVKRYAGTIKRHIERLQGSLELLPTMVKTLEDFADGNEVPRPVVERAIREILAIMTLPVIPCLSGVYTPKEFWRKEPIARLITKCEARLKS